MAIIMGNQSTSTQLLLPAPAIILDETNGLGTDSEQEFIKYKPNSIVDSKLRINAVKLIRQDPEVVELKEIYDKAPFDIETSVSGFGVEASFVSTQLRILLANDQGVLLLPAKFEMAVKTQELLSKVGRKLISIQMGVYRRTGGSLAVNSDHMVAWILDHLKTVISTANHTEILVYNRVTGVYVSDKEVNLLAKLITKYLMQFNFGDQLVTPALVMDVKNAVLSLSETRPESEFDKQYRVFKNLDLSLKDLKWVHHSPDHLARHRSDVNIDPQAEMPKIHQFLNQIIGVKETQLVLQQYAGYILDDSFKLEAFMIFLGRGANGKSVTISLLSHAVGMNNISAVPMTKLSTRFGSEPMVGKWLNVSTEDDAEAFATKKLKSIASGETIPVDRKNEKELTTRISAKLIFAMNENPIMSESGLSIDRRMYVIPFKQTFSRDQQDPKLTDKLLQELPGFVLWMVEGLRMLRSSGYKLMDSSEMLKIKQEIFLGNLPVDAFVDDELVASNVDCPIRSNELFERFKTWCELQNRNVGRITSSKSFRPEFINACSRQLGVRVIFKKNSVMYAHGVQWKATLQVAEGDDNK
ncbi:MAG TPA: hypothetical protein DCW31_11795 [Lactobacillus sp.]|nr:hypothetical protein [Lactobacillus sp.]